MIGKSARYHRHSSLRPRAGQRPKSAFRQLTIQPVWRSYISSPRPKPRPFLPTTETTGCVGLAGNLHRVALLAASVLTVPPTLLSPADGMDVKREGGSK